jgi:hypothetical protein
MTRGTTLTPADKLRRLAAKYKIPGLVDQQPTTQAIYDTLDLNALSTTSDATLSFFSGLNARFFPDTNLQSNTFSAGQALLIQNIAFAIITKSSGTITDIQPLEDTIYKPLLAGYFSLILTGQTVWQTYPLALGYAPFNPDAKFHSISVGPTAAAAWAQRDIGHGSIVSDVDLGIVPNREFVLPVRLPKIAAVPSAGTKFLQVLLSGYGTLPALQGTT